MRNDSRSRTKLQLSEVQDRLFDLMCYIDAFCNRNQIPYYMLGGTALGARRHNGFIPWDDDIDIGMLREDYERFLSVSDELTGDFVVKNYRNSKNCDSVITRLYFLNTEVDNPAMKDPWFDKRFYFDIFPLDYVPLDRQKMETQSKALKNMKKLIWWSMPFRHSSSIIKRTGAHIIHTCLTPLHNCFLRKTDKIMAEYRREDACGICSMASQYSYEKQNMPINVYGTPARYKFRDKYFLGPENIDAYLSQLFGYDYMQVPPESKRRAGFDIYEIKTK